MTRFELKKIFSRRINQIVLLIIAGLTAVCIFMGLNAVSYSIPDENAEYGVRHISGRAAAMRLRADAAQYEGPLTEETLRRIIEENARLKSMPQAQSKDVADIAYENYIYCLTQGYKDIRALCAVACTGFQEYDYYALDRLKPEDADRFYTMRTQQMLEWLNLPENAKLFTQAEREFIKGRYEALEIPITYHPYMGWDAVFDKAPTLLMIMTFLLGFLLAELFACESRLKTDAIFYSSCHGRKKAVWAKVKAGLILTNVMYWGCMLVFSGVLLLILGGSGWDCPVQITIGGWKSLYNITILQKYLLLLVCGWAGISFTALMSMLVSARTNSATLSVAVPFLLIFLPQIVSGVAGSSSAVSGLLGLLPDHLLQVSVVMNTFNLYTLGGKILAELEITPWLYLIISALLVPLVYTVYRRRNPA